MHHVHAAMQMPKHPEEVLLGYQVTGMVGYLSVSELLISYMCV
jgi:hypothetical protein